MKKLRRRTSRVPALGALTAVAFVFLALGATGASAALTGAGAQKNCTSPVLVGDPVVCTYGFTNQDDFGNNETVNSLVDVTQTAGGALSSGNIFSSVGWVFEPTPNAGTNPNASPSCVGGSGAGTDASPYFGATSCTVPVSIVNILGTNFTIGARIRSAPFSWYTSTAADFGLPNHQLSDQDDFTWQCTVGNGSSCSPTTNNHATAPATVTLQQRGSNTATSIHNAAHQVVTAVAAGSIVHDFVTVTGAPQQPVPTGKVTLDWFTNGTCTNPPLATSGQLTLDAAGTVDASAFPQTVATPGQYSFKAHYLGDGEYTPSDGPCEPLQVVDANITITPDATNEVGHAHTFTVTVKADNGLGGGLQPAAGASVTTSIANSNGANSQMTGGTCGAASGSSGSGTTNASGQCTVIINGTSAGLTVANASATLTVAGVSLTRDTDPATGTSAGTGGSGPATKQYVDARITIAPSNATNPTGASHTFTVTVQQDDGLTSAQGGDGVTGFTAASGAAVTTSIANSNGATSSMTGGTCGNTSGTTGSGTTNASGQCTIVITSPTAGLTTANASATFSITGLFNNVTVTRDTNPATATIGAGPGGSGPANKLWILTHVRDTANNDITNQSVAQPATVHDEFTTGSTAGGAPPAGNVTFTLFQSGNCTGTIVQVGGNNTETVNVVNGLASSTAITLNPATDTQYSYLAHYNGDGTFPAQDASCEPFTVKAAPQGQITPTQTTCSDFTSGTAQTLGQVNYSVSGGTIGQGINPGVFFFYSKITTTVPNQVVTVTQSNNSTNNAALFGVLNGQAWLWTGDCVSKTVGTVFGPNDGNARYTIPTPGTYIISIKYNTKSIAGTAAPVPANITYSWVTSLGGQTGASVLLKKQ
jgi:hypothetical protein